MPRRKKSRIYWRSGRAWADFRDFEGGRREALKPDGAALATDDPTTARVLCDRRLKELKTLRRQLAIMGEGAHARQLEEFASQHLVEKARSGNHPRRYILDLEFMLKRACDYFKPRTPLAAVHMKDVLAWANHLRRTVAGKGGERLTEGRVRAHLMALSNLYTSAKAEGAVANSYNPVNDILACNMPKAERREAFFLEQHEAWALLEAARQWQPPAGAFPHMYELIGTLLLTGGRPAEILGLEADDVSFQRSTVTIRPKPWRRLKTSHSHRVIPLWPQLAAILGPYIVPEDRPPLAGLLFPWRGGMLTTVPRRQLAAIAAAAELDADKVTPKVCRHSYCSARLQTVDSGFPVSEDIVRREMGHGTPDMVREVYGHLGQIRQRTEGVEFLPAPKVPQRQGGAA